MHFLAVGNELKLTEVDTGPLKIGGRRAVTLNLEGWNDVGWKRGGKFRPGGPCTASYPSRHSHF